jgi:hypothetical protein
MLLLSLGGSPALAADVVPIEKGDPAPFTGMLYPTENALRITRKVERFEFLLTEGKKKAQMIADHERQNFEERLRIITEGCKMKEDIALEAIGNSSPMQDLIVGFVIGAATVALSAWVLQKATDQ